jgi:hypothetical protein
VNIAEGREQSRLSTVFIEHAPDAGSFPVGKARAEFGEMQQAPNSDARQGGGQPPTQ